MTPNELRKKFLLDNWRIPEETVILIQNPYVDSETWTRVLSIEYLEAEVIEDDVPIAIFELEAYVPYHVYINDSIPIRIFKEIDYKSGEVSSGGSKYG